MHLEKPGTWQHGVSTCKGVDFLGNQQLPPEHMDAVRKFHLASRKAHSGELHALFRRGGLTQIDALYGDVLVAL